MAVIPVLVHERALGRCEGAQLVVQRLIPLLSQQLCLCVCGGGGGGGET